MSDLPPVTATPAAFSALFSNVDSRALERRLVAAEAVGMLKGLLTLNEIPAHSRAQARAIVSRYEAAE